MSTTIVNAIFKVLRSSQIVHLKLTLVAKDSDISKLTEHPEIPAKPSGKTSFNIAEIADI